MKKKEITNADENSLKPGQRFIEDKEVENIFNLLILYDDIYFNKCIYGNNCLIN